MLQFIKPDLLLFLSNFEIVLCQKISSKLNYTFSQAGMLWWILAWFWFFVWNDSKPLFFDLVFSNFETGSLSEYLSRLSVFISKKTSLRMCHMIKVIWHKFEDCGSYPMSRFRAGFIQWTFTASLPPKAGFLPPVFRHPS